MNFENLELFPEDYFDEIKGVKVFVERDSWKNY
jgi:hypothetical protein